MSRRRTILAAAVLAASAGSALAQTPVGSAFTYQGKLAVSGQPANGSFDLQFKLFDAASGGVQIGSTVSAAGAAVAGGLFTQTLDFGAPAFNGAQRFLEIGIKPAGQPVAYTTLTPRQPLTPAPYAVGLALPYDGTQSRSNGAILSIHNTSPVPGAYGIAAFASGVSLYGQTSSGIGVWGYHLGTTGNAGLFRTESNNNTSATVLSQAGGGAAFHGVAAIGSAAIFDASGNVPAVLVNESGLSNAGLFKSTNPSNTAAAVSIENNGWGPGIAAIVTGPGKAASFAISNGANTSPALEVFTSGTGPAATFSATGNRPAVSISNGGIQVQGAGLGSNTPAFIHLATASNLAALGNGGSAIDNPYCNANPGAILIVTPNYSAATLGANPKPVMVMYYANVAGGRWALLHADGSNIAAGETWNILAIRP